MIGGAKVWAATLGALLALLVAFAVPPSGADAEQASEPPAPAAGGLDSGRSHSCAVLPGASLRCWGYGGDGALGYANRLTIGDDETPADAGPVDVGAGRTVVAVSAGSVHTCALLDAGAVRCWGFGGNGRLGYVNTDSVGDDEAPGSAGPVDLGPGRTARAITAGRAHTCAVLDNATVRCWGFGFDGRLGYATNIPNDNNNIGDNETPGSIGPVALGAGRTARAVTTGDAHTCALLDDGNVRCWGFAANGQLGYGNIENIGDNETPDTAGPVRLGAGRTAVAIAAGDFHTCALLDNGTVRCWGFGGNGRLGYANTATIGDNETPDAFGPVDLGPGRTARAITAGNAQTCALLDDRSVRCWGFGLNGQLGYGNGATIGDDEPPAAAGPVDLGPGRTALAVSSGGDHTCVRLDDGAVRCWGIGAAGELGNCATTSIGDDESPASAGPVDLGVPGVAGARCPPAPPPAAPGPVAAAPVPAAATPDAPASDPLRLQAARAASLRSCRATALRRARSERNRARRLYPSGPRRARALRLVQRRAAQERRRCLTRFGRTPGRVTTLAARATAGGRVVLSFKAPGTDGSKPPAATRYVIRQSPRPIRTARDFARAHALCSGTCRFAVTKLRADVTLTVTQLRRRTTYYYAIAARDNVSGRLGPRSRTVAVRTR